MECFVLRKSPINENLFYEESVVPDKSVWAAQANPGRHFKHMHYAPYSQNAAYILSYKGNQLSDNGAYMCSHKINICLNRTEFLQQINKKKYQCGIFL